MFYDEEAPLDMRPPMTEAEEEMVDHLDRFNRAWIQLVFMPTRQGVGAYLRYLAPDEVTVEWIERDDLHLPLESTDELLRRLFTFWLDELADGMSVMASLQIIVGGPFQAHADPALGPRIMALLEGAVTS